MKNKYPVYIVSKGRWESRLTAKTLERMGVDYKIIIEEQELPQYSAVIDPKKILILPKKYQEEYDTCDELGDTKSKGPGAARNFAWDHSIEQGAERHWVLDDNIRSFMRLNKNLKYKVYTPTAFRIMEDFVDRYENVPLAGPNYDYFVPRKKKIAPFSVNTRIYSCLLIKNDLNMRWRGRYNEDTDLTLRVLKAGYCTIQFYAILQEKSPTQTVKGGNDKDFYSKEGTLPKSAMQVKLHPDVSQIVWRYGRWHHEVNYDPFKYNKLIKKNDINIVKGINEYDMKFKDTSEEEQS